MSRTGPPRPLTLRHPAALVGTAFGVGFFPFAPGTAGSLAALPVGALIAIYLGPVGLIVAAAIVLIAGTWAADIYTRESGDDDPSAIVADEVAGQWLALVAVPVDPLSYGAAFLLFRFFDIAKVWPANYVERRIKGGLGVMLDDIVAGIYALAAYHGLSLAIEAWF